MFHNRIKKENEHLKRELVDARKQIAQLCCGHSIWAHEFVVDNTVVGKNIRRCKQCGKVLQYYYHKTDLMEADKQEWERLMILERKNG
jgi:DNA-directed RNA polymerase subunit N (RpoN/RPB10)